MYLILYNTACMLGWFYLWVLQYRYYSSELQRNCRLIDRGGDFWALIGTPLKWVQTAAVLEIVHSMLGIVRSPAMTTALEGITSYLNPYLVFSRVMLVWGYANLDTVAQQSWSVRLMVLR